jgi:hypothetical protein
MPTLGTIIADMPNLARTDSLEVSYVSFVSRHQGKDSTVFIRSIVFGISENQGKHVPR